MSCLDDICLLISSRQRAIMKLPKQVIVAYSWINYTLLAIHLYAIVYFLGCMYISFMQRIPCPYYAITGRNCILCGYTRMTIEWLREGKGINFALSFFIICFGTQTLLRTINVFIGRTRRPYYIIFDLSLYGFMWSISIALFYIAQKISIQAT